MSKATDPKGFDRTKAVAIEPYGVAPHVSFRVYSAKRKLLGAFDTEKAATEFRDSLSLDKILL